MTNEKFKTKEEATSHIEKLEKLIMELKETLEWSYGLVEPSLSETDFDREVKSALEKAEMLIE